MTRSLSLQHSRNLCRSRARRDGAWVLPAVLLLAAGSVLAADGGDTPVGPGDPAACPMQASGDCPMSGPMQGQMQGHMPRHGYDRGGRAAPGPARAALGIAIADDGEPGAVAGVTVASVAPASGAAEAGLRAGDLITAVNSESLAAGSRAEANGRLVRFMASVNPGEEVAVTYRRDGREQSARVEARGLAPSRQAWQPWMQHHHRGGPFRGLRLAALSPDLGRYFGATAGLLVLRVPETAGIPLRDGDVIREIGGREPRGPGHARSILASYAPGETVTLRILRDRKGQTLKFTVPAPGPAGEGPGPAVPRD